MCCAAGPPIWFLTHTLAHRCCSACAYICCCVCCSIRIYCCCCFVPPNYTVLMLLVYFLLLLRVVTLLLRLLLLHSRVLLVSLSWKTTVLLFQKTGLLPSAAGKLRLAAPPAVPLQHPFCCCVYHFPSHGICHNGATETLQ